MDDFSEIAPAFVEMAHRIVWASAATVDAYGRPRSRILHPIWQWDGVRLLGWIGTSPTPAKRAHLNASTKCKSKIPMVTSSGLVRSEGPIGPRLPVGETCGAICG